MNYLALTEEITLNDGVFCVPSSIFIYLNILVIPLIIGIILLSDIMRISSILDSDQDYQKRLKERQNRSVMNLVSKSVPWPSFHGTFRLFIYDINDPRGINLGTLVAGREYDTFNFEGSQGYALRRNSNILHTNLDGSEDVRVPVLTPSLALVEGRGVQILSRGLPIARQHTLTGGTTLLVKKETPGVQIPPRGPSNR